MGLASVQSGRRLALLLLMCTAAVSAAPDKKSAADHWAFKPPVRPAIPKVRNANAIGTAVDAFILSKLEQRKLGLSAEADRGTLIRRLSFDLRGMPPSPEEVEEFQNDKRPDAYEQLVERYLASPHYGERWGRHWLDVAGYADSNGYFDADSDRPLAYLYRDYVIRCFNSDKPFDDFIREQIAGDELAGYEPDGDVTPDMVDRLVATHFLRNAPDGTGESDGNAAELRVDRYAVLEGTSQIIGSAFFGMTVQCSKCHDHKFEPLTQEEYYQLQSILRPAYNPDKWIKPNDRALIAGTKAEREKNKRELDEHEKQVKALKESLDGLLKPWRKIVLTENLAGLPESDRKEIEKALDTKEKERSAKMKELLKTHEKLVQIKDEDLAKRFEEIRPSYDDLKSALAKREANPPAALPKISVLTEPRGMPPTNFVLVRGNYAKPGKAVEPGVPAVLSKGGFGFEVHAQSSGSSGRRSALARWLTDPSHPTTARLIVNRIWQHHFGVGIVSTPDNFGVTGAKPTHPELLDWLATELVQSGWSVKHIQRLIVNSATYRQSSAIRQNAYDADPDNSMLWRFSVQRLDAEALRDAMLSATGELDEKMFGPAIQKAKTEEGQYIVNESDPGARRRSVYLQQKRSGLVTFLDVFDAAKMNPNCVQRTSSTVPLQSLAMLNSDFMRARSKRFAASIASDDISKTVDLAFVRAVGRPPTEGERKSSLEFIDKEVNTYGSGADAKTKALTDFCQMLFASNAFLYVE